MDLPLDYPTLRVIWWVLMGVLLIGFAITDGFDLGTAALLPFVAKTDGERRMVINTVAPTWEGNQVWFILGGGAIFAAWPLVYAVSFSGFYLAMFLVLAALILRPVGFKYRSKREDKRWRTAWDWALFVGGFVPALVFGVAVGNVLTGAPFRFDSDLRSFYDGNLQGMFTPFTLVCGLLSVCMLVLHGAAWVSLRAELGLVTARAKWLGERAGIAAIALFFLGFLFMAFGGYGFEVVTHAGPAAPSNPLRTETVAVAGAWLANYVEVPALVLVPLIGFAGLAAALWGIREGREGIAFTGSSAACLGIIGTVGVSMFPIILPSTIDPNSSLTVWNASSTHSTLFLMLIVTLVFLPIVLAYTGWVFKVLWGRTTLAQVQTNPDLY